MAGDGDGDAGRHGGGGGGRDVDRCHFLVAAYGYQGHLTPARALARRLASGGARVTLSVAASAHARMFPSPAPGGSPGDEEPEEASDGLIAYAPYSDGFGFGSRPRTAEERARWRRESADSLSRVLARLRAAGRPVTCVVSAMLLPAADAAAVHGVPLAVFWNQSAAALAAYYHYFHRGHDDERGVVAAPDPAREEVWLLPGMPALRVPRDLPSLIVDATGGGVSDKAAGAVDTMRALVEVVGRGKPTVLVNTLDALEVEADALQAMRQHQRLDVVAVGAVAVPMVVPLRRQRTDAAAGGGEEDRIHLFERDRKGYMEWLDARPGSSVVYVSFGSMLGYDKRQVEEMLRGLRGSGRPYLWVVPKDGRDEEVERCLTDNGGGGGGAAEEQRMVLEWCDQIEVLSHPSTGCFVTHCGWNSTLEAVATGVPVVAVPYWSDQPLNARLVEEWGVGVRAERDASGLLVGAELASCVEAVMGDGDEARSIHERVRDLKDQVRREVVHESGRVDSRLQNFIAAMQNRK
ncbi:hypothetical protein U9M48_005259 [Paspalum notatum var. saurae]|uniref:Glycosyltransferase n=1 Tax=Paspalum notatum var. saurae TaxID=547442 RepID=A0AAQ3PX70_PASNO